ncbi:MAG: PAS domain-containing protein, partial [Candidatus Marinimicrobia bacterium]|nr:PAS domain-containing protein [Candidatus Neomarinimicrobiota bacterium]
MSYAFNQASKIFIAGFLLIIIGTLFFYNINYNNLIKYQLKYSKYFADEISGDTNDHLLEKIKIVKTLSLSPILIDALNESNRVYRELSDQGREDKIQLNNETWKAIKKHDNPFILEYTENKISQYFKAQQNNLKGEYGEIFLTNKYGALVSSSAKLTTFAHGHKYWWKGAYKNGEGAIYLDDRGYDESVGTYVLGIVIPIKKGDEIIGIIKANLNIIGSINTMLQISNNEITERLLLVRSGGLIIYEKDGEPLSKSVSLKLLEQLQEETNTSFMLHEENKEWIVGQSEIKITSDLDGFIFGGNNTSISQKYGNVGESWHILHYYPITSITEYSKNNLKMYLYFGLILLLIIVIFSYLFGKRIAKPLLKLVEQTKRISEGDFNTNFFKKRNDEIGVLANSFNQMSVNLKNNTTSIDNLNKEIISREQMQEKLKDTNQRLIESQRIAKLGHWELDLVNNLLLWSDEVYKIFDIEPQKFKPTYEAFLNNVHPEDRDMVKETYTDSLKTKTPYNIIHRLLLKNGKIKYINEICITNFDESGQALKSLGTIQDITQRKRAENLLNFEKQKVQNYLNIVGVMLLAINEEGVVTLINKAGCDILGYPEEEILNKYWIDNFLPEYQRVQVKKVFNDNILGKIGMKEHYENPVLTKSGTERLIAWHNTTLRDEEGKIIGSLSSGEDITEKRQLEEQLRQSQKLEGIGQLAGGIAHDFNNILAALYGFTEMALMKVEDGSKVHNILLQIKASNERAAKLVRQILAFSRKQVFTPIHLNINKTIDDLNKMIRRLIGEDIDMNMNLSSESLFVEADPSQIEQVIINLFVNARDAIKMRNNQTQDKQISITTEAVEISNPLITSTSTIEKGNYIIISVKDTGIGMNKETLKQIF